MKADADRRSTKGGNMFENFDHLSITQLAAMFGIEAVEMGRRLKKIGFREWDHQKGEYVPTVDAIRQNLAQLIDPGDGRGDFYAWEKERTVSALRTARWRVAGAPAGPCRPWRRWPRQEV